MSVAIKLEEIEIRTEIKTGDLGFIVHTHGKLYGAEYHYGISFEMYVAAGTIEFYKQYNDRLDRLWTCEHHGKTIGSLLLMHRENNAAQLRYFLLDPGYRNIGLGKKLMCLYKAFLTACGYTSSYLWTTNEQHAAAALYIKNGFILSEEKESIAFGKPLVEQRYDLVCNVIGCNKRIKPIYTAQGEISEKMTDDSWRMMDPICCFSHLRYRQLLSVNEFPFHFLSLAKYKTGTFIHVFF